MPWKLQSESLTKMSKNEANEIRKCWPWFAPIWVQPPLCFGASMTGNTALVIGAMVLLAGATIVAFVGVVRSRYRLTTFYIYALGGFVVVAFPTVILLNVIRVLTGRGFGQL